MKDLGEQDALASAHFASELGVPNGYDALAGGHMGVRHPESVAEHNLRVSQPACLVATIEGAEPAHAALLAI